MGASVRAGQDKASHRVVSDHLARVLVTTPVLRLRKILSNLRMTVFVGLGHTVALDVILGRGRELSEWN